MIFTDTVGPTLQINFLRPLTHERLKNRSGVWIVTEKAVERAWELSGEDGLISALRDMFSDIGPTVVIASRFSSFGADALPDLARMSGATLIAHLDDNLFLAGRSRTDSGVRVGGRKNLDYLAHVLRRADLAYISTAPLLAQLQSLSVVGSNTYVARISGAIEPFAAPRQSNKKMIRFGYMGSKSHTEDLSSIAPAIRAILKRYPQINFEIFGSVELPLELADFSVTKHAKEKNYDIFLRKLTDLNWDFGLAPLIETEFTQAKTNIKWIEYTAAGIPMIASNHPIYRNCCSDGAGLLALTLAEWENAISLMLTDADFRASTLGRARQRLEKEYCPEKLIEQLKEVLSAAGAKTRL